MTKTGVGAQTYLLMSDCLVYDFLNQTRMQIFPIIPHLTLIAHQTSHVYSISISILAITVRICILHFHHDRIRFDAAFALTNNLPWLWHWPLNFLSIPLTRCSFDCFNTSIILYASCIMQRGATNYDCLFVVFILCYFNSSMLIFYTF